MRGSGGVGENIKDKRETDREGGEILKVREEERAKIKDRVRQ